MATASECAFPVKLEGLFFSHKGGKRHHARAKFLRGHRSFLRHSVNKSAFGHRTSVEQSLKSVSQCPAHVTLRHATSSSEQGRGVCHLWPKRQCCWTSLALVECNQITDSWNSDSWHVASQCSVSSKQKDRTNIFVGHLWAGVDGHGKDSISPSNSSTQSPGLCLRGSLQYESPWPRDRLQTFPTTLLPRTARSPTPSCVSEHRDGCALFPDPYLLINVFQLALNMKYQAIVCVRTLGRGVPERFPQKGLCTWPHKLRSFVPTCRKISAQSFFGPKPILKSSAVLYSQTKAN